MKYMKQLNEFWRIQTLEPISSNAKLLYLALLNINNMGNWEKEFKVNNDFLVLLSGLSISTLQRARNELEQKGYIKYHKGKKNKSAPTYSVIKLYDDVLFKNDQDLNNTLGNTLGNTLNNTLGNTPNNTLNTIYRQDETKLKETKQDNSSSSTSEKNETAEDVLNNLGEYMDDYDEDVLNALYEYVYMRKVNDKPITGYALRLRLEELKQLSSDNKERVNIINQSINSNWYRFYKINREDNNQNNTGNTKNVSDKNKQDNIFSNNTNKKEIKNILRLDRKEMERKIEMYDALLM